MFDSKNIKIYNSLTNQLEQFVPLKENEISMYVCGPTVYNHMHIGNARPVIFFDTVKRFFKHIGYKVTYASNFTDIDDKIIKAALSEGVSEDVITTRYIKAFLDACEAVGCEMDVIRPKVTENIPAILEFIEKLVDNGNAYVSGDDVYFKVSSDPKYGVLSNQKLDELELGARIDVNEGKLDPRDFTLWKKTSDIGKKWDSAFGSGRPGWHTECVVMIRKIFGGLIDIHGGGTDLRFPHHENEIAQNYCLHNDYLANYWVHNARLDLRGEKMSKSLGNVVWLKDIIKEYHPNAFRLAILANHYRQVINYQDDMMRQMQGEWEKIEKLYVSVFRKLELQDALNDGDVLDVMNEFLTEMAYDFNTANAITHMYSLMKKMNADVRRNDLGVDILQSEFKTFKDMLYVLGINVDINPLSNEEKTLVIDWQNARKNKDFEKADELRNKINELGIRL
ncbi:MAG: cysteine--tRNA ligase [Bacilli bacterium]|nr:cysteine--tRNA ligase [Bacilli bacterium]